MFTRSFMIRSAFHWATTISGAIKRRKRPIRNSCEKTSVPSLCYR